MNKGYQIIELDQLVGIYGKPKHFSFAVTIFYWLIDLLQAELKEQLNDVEIEVIKVEYVGAYPTLGVHYKTEIQDVEPLITTTIDRLLREKTVIELIGYIAASNVDWEEITSSILTRDVI